MRKRRILIVNWMMMVSLIIVFVTGLLLKSMPGMWMGIMHSVSGLFLVIGVAVHCVQHRRTLKYHN